MYLINFIYRFNYRVIQWEQIDYLLFAFNAHKYQKTRNSSTSRGALFPVEISFAHKKKSSIRARRGKRVKPENLYHPTPKTAFHDNLFAYLPRGAGAANKNSKITRVSSIYIYAYIHYKSTFSRRERELYIYTQHSISGAINTAGLVTMSPSLTRNMEQHTRAVIVDDSL